MTPTGIELPRIQTQFRVAQGYWNLMSVERHPVGFGVRYKPHYRFLKWDHSRFDKDTPYIWEYVRNG